MEWISKNYKTTPAKRSEVMVTVTKDGDKKVTNFTFYNGSEKKIGSTGYLVYALTATRVYFKAADIKTGFKLYNKTENSISTRFKIIRNLTKFIGDYNLLFDNNEGCWYIDMTQKTDGKVPVNSGACLNDEQKNTEALSRCKEFKRRADEWH